MADLPEAIVTIDDEAGASGTGTDILTVMSCVEKNADLVPRMFASTDALLAKHGYSDGVDYSALHFDEDNKPIIFIGLPTATPGAIGQVDQSGNTGSSVVSVAAGANGVLERVDATVTVNTGGEVGVDQILLDLSLDGLTTRTVRVGTATTYTIERLGLVLNLTAGELNAGDVVLRFKTTPPMWDAAGIAAARAALAAEQKRSRNWLCVGDINDEALAASVLTQINAYATAVGRHSLARVQVRDRKVASMTGALKRMTGAPTLTFADVGPTGDTITRSGGSWVTDGFAVGDFVTIEGSASNNLTAPIMAVTATVLTFGSVLLTAEVAAAGCTVTGSAGITFAEVGVTGDTITRTAGSWIDDGFAVGDTVTVGGTSLNNRQGPIAAVTATVLTLGDTDLEAEAVASHRVTITVEELDADWVADITDEFEAVADAPRIDMGAGRNFKESPITHWKFPRNVAWAASLREYSPRIDLQIPTWRKNDGVLTGWSFNDASDKKVHHDERVDGGLLLGGFTCFRSYANGPVGSFIAMSLTRAVDGSLLSYTHNMHVTNLACNVAQAETENAIGEVLVLNADGTATGPSLVTIEERVNTALAIALLQRKAGNPPRASGATWEASRSDVLNVPNAELTGTLDLMLNGTIVKIRTRVRVLTAG
jgi:hypothetical protein